MYVPCCFYFTRICDCQFWFMVRRNICKSFGGELLELFLLSPILFIYLFIGLLVVVSFDSNLGGGGFKRISDLNSNQNTINNKQSEEWMLCALFLNSDCLFLHFLWISEFSSFSRSRKLWEGSRLRLHIVGICAESTVYLV